MKIRNKQQVRLFGTALLLLSAFVGPFVLSQTASAAQLGQVTVRFDRMQTSTATTGFVCAKPTSTGTEAKVAVAFPSGYTLGAAATFTVDTTTNTASWPSGGTAWPSIATATAVSGQTVTFPSGDLTVGTLYCFNWINSAAVTVSSSASASNLGSVTTQTSANATIDSGQYATASITNDQIVVTATVPSAFSFALSGNTDALGTLSTATIASSPTPRTTTVNTNARNGWAVWAKDSNAGLNSATTGGTIASNCTSGAGSNSTLSAGTEGYNTGVTSSQTAGSGTVTIASIFTGGVSGKGGGLCTNLQTLATSNGTASNSVLTLTNNATIGALTAAANDYTDTITVVGAGLF